MPKDIEVLRKPVIDWLVYIREMNTRISYLESRISEIRDRLCGMGYDPASQGGSASSADKIPSGVATLAELEDEWNQRVKDTQREIEEARELCSPTNTGRYVLWLRYVDRRSWKDISNSVSYSPKQCRRIAEGGIRDLYPLIPEIFRRNAFPNAAPL